MKAGLAFLVFWLQNTIEPFVLFYHSVFFIIYNSLRCFTIEVEDPHRDHTYVCNLGMHQNLKVRCRASEAGFSPKTECLLTFQDQIGWIPCWSLALFVHHWFHTWRLFCHYLFLITPYIVDSRYLEVKWTLWTTSRYPYLDISDLQNWGKHNSSNHI